MQIKINTWKKILFCIYFSMGLQIYAQEKIIPIIYQGSELVSQDSRLLKSLCKLNKGLKGNTYWMDHVYDARGLNNVKNQGMIANATSRYGFMTHRNIDDVAYGVMREGLKYRKQTIVWVVNGHYAMITGYKGAAYKLNKTSQIGSSRINLSINTKDVESVTITDSLQQYASLFPNRADREFFLSLKAVVCEVKRK